MAWATVMSKKITLCALLYISAGHTKDSRSGIIATYKTKTKWLKRGMSIANARERPESIPVEGLRVTELKRRSPTAL